jgi:hypothetical protein
MKAAAARVCVAPMSPEGAMRMLFNGVCLYFFESTRGLEHVLQQSLFGLLPIYTRITTRWSLSAHLLFIRC